MTTEKRSHNIHASRMDQNHYLNLAVEEQPSGQRKTRHCDGFKVFFIALVFSFICKTLSGIIMKSSITQIERRFEVSSSIAGLIDGGFEIGNLLVIVFVSYFGSKLHRPKLIGIGCIVMGTGSILTALPHFFMGHYRYSEENIDPSTNSTSSFSTCLINQTVLFNRTSPEIVEKACMKESGSYTWIYVLTGNILRGIGEAPMVPLGISYIDDFAKAGESSFYIGTLSSVAMIGLVIGFLLSSQLAKVYVDIGFVDLGSVRITPKDSRWVGAWWLGFLIAGLFSIISSITFFFVPKNLNKPQKERKTSIHSQASNTNKEMKPTAKLTNDEQNVTGFLQSLKSILTNPLYVLHLSLSLLYLSSLIGIVTFVFKYIEQQFGQSIADANFWIGLIATPAVALGLFTGGYAIKKLNLSLVGIAKLSFLILLLNFTGQILNFFLICENKPVAGLTLTYDGKKTEASQINAPLSYCNSDCNCDKSQWEPVCGKNGITYLSPCLAGCKHSGSNRKSKMFYNCSCVDMTGFQNRNNSVHLGECPRSEHCRRRFYLHLGLHTVLSFLQGLGSTSTVMLIFKNVQPELKSLAVGFHSLTVRSLGGILAPVYFGAVIDRTCLKWSINSCGKQGSCRIYNSTLYGTYFFGLILSLKASSIILFIIFLYAMKKKYQGKNAKTVENVKKVVNEENLESLKNNRPFIPSAGDDGETCI